MAAGRGRDALPRHMQIVERINAQHLDGLRASGPA